jgi:molybdopterin/thiamine biosynthesis adenylyltransferase
MNAVVVVGAGGNIGSHLVPLLARQPELGRLTLIDPDLYEPANICSQAVAPRDVGRAKARVQAARARRIRPELAVEAIVAAVEQVPLGRLRASWIVACLDSRRARQVVNQAARRLGQPWIDAGVAASGRLARVTVYGASAASACIECGWDARDYASLEQSYPCGAAGAVPPTAAPAALGALAAALAALACEAPATDAAVARDARELVLAAGAGRLLRSRAPRRTACLLPEHAPWQIRWANLDPRQATLGELVALGTPRLRGAEPRLTVAGRRFGRHWRCSACGYERATLRVTPTLCASRCRRCGGRLVAVGFAASEELDVRELAPRVLARPLAALGLLPGDVVTLRAGARSLHLEIGSDRR